ncbi:hypothetical protein J8I29_04400 [Labrys sp. LIt4]|uniref:P-type conjugative transfer protein TrbG n=1 Tax=Labrys okinawensis TaxID=346911 RepID=A0A2S9Q4L2_9HYPH|nr:MULTISPECIES: hypothetical protein [Labrys]MBP0578543.1 hypothetical protein [Labrys sp. LIt4]PRH84299.1 hypothetical protein C5L14_27540 [Labrys okinawensis]
MKIAIPTALAVALSACAPPPKLAVGPDPSNPDTPVPRLHYTPVTSGTLDFRPVEPRPWVERNDRVAPKREGQ